MKLLIITQKVHRNDPILGFFHRWLQEFAKHCEQVTVIGQLVGEYDLPGNVHVLSLYKEKGLSKFQQILRFWKLIIAHRSEYDAVLVHMTPVWIDLGAPLWLVLRKPMYLWYEIRRGGFVLQWALLWIKKVFSATPDGLPFPHPKNVVTGHGIDTAFFQSHEEKRDPHLSATVGRMTKIKRFDVIINAFARLPETMHLTIGGGAITQEDHTTEREIKALIERNHLGPRVQTGFLSQQEVASLLRRATLFLHACGGGLDKVVLEAMASGCLVVSCSEAARHVLPPECIATPENMAEVANALLRFPESRLESLRHDLRARVEREHGLSSLVERLCREMSSNRVTE